MWLKVRGVAASLEIRATWVVESRTIGVQNATTSLGTLIITKIAEWGHLNKLGSVSRELPVIAKNTMYVYVLVLLSIGKIALFGQYTRTSWGI